MIVGARLLDSVGVYWSAAELGYIILVVGGALLAFVSLWWKGKLDMGEEPKMEMLEADEYHPLPR